jgi:ABC-type phosphate/phosphonate transport system substrate-binding protein
VSVRNLTAAALLALIALPLAAQAVPATQQAALFSRILAYDRHLKARAGSQVTVGILFKADNPASRAAADEMLAGFAPLKARTIQDLPFDVASAPYADANALGDWLDARNVDVVYLAPGLDAAFGAIQAVAAQRKIPTLTSDRRQVQQGAAIGVVSKDGKPAILINLGSARAIGMDLDPKLLQLAEVIR